MNKFGLARDIPDPVKRAVRQRDGFGCVMCGKAVIQYEHFDPEFADAHSHDANGIILLCSEHHDLKTRGILSRETIARYLQNPKCKEIGYSFGPFDIGVRHPNIYIGNMRCSNVRCILQFDGEELISIAPPESAGQPFRLTARIRNLQGEPTLEIVENEWRSNASNWDVVVEGRRITIRRGTGDIVLRLRTEPPNEIYVETLKMLHKGHLLTCREGQDLKLSTRGGASFTTSEMSIDGSDTAISCDENALKVAVGGGSVQVKGATISSADRPSTSRSATNVQQPVFHCWCGLKFVHTHGAVTCR